MGDRRRTGGRDGASSRPWQRLQSSGALSFAGGSPSRAGLARCGGRGRLGVRAWMLPVVAPVLSPTWPGGQSGAGWASQMGSEGRNLQERVREAGKAFFAGDTRGTDLLGWAGTGCSGAEGRGGEVGDSHSQGLWPQCRLAPGGNHQRTLQNPLSRQYL